ncbi:ABC transporter permease [Sporosarcina sp. Sa2YVA2]|uniref:ABC transporter permease n=1 Tax=Sporosarcina quadrami TaxID=2762234 RepID=A0ABR8UD72_9BACL|nr:ABC transporter permease [Sporosarcina quadrami]MBD7985966.1 ABC transporter permease [Sporosarcina quadrami]
MINYLKSEQYRMLRKKSLHLTSLVCLLLISAAGAVLAYFGKTDPTFPYATSNFYYSNVLGGAGLIILVAFIVNFSLTGKDTTVLKNTISFGIKRKTVYWSKLILTFIYFLVLCIIGLSLLIGIGETFLASESGSISNLLAAVANMVPIILSAFLLIHTLKLLNMGDVYILVILLGIYGFAGNLLWVVAKKFPFFKKLYEYAPDTLMGRNLMGFMDKTAQIGYPYFLTGGLLAAAAIVIGIIQFSKKPID